MSKPSALAVRLHDRLVGVITRLGGDRTIFTFDEAYTADEAHPTLSLSFQGENGELLTEHRAFRSRLMPFFSNLLPEGVLRTYLAKRAGLSEHAEFDLLATLGADLPGAISVAPVDGPAVAGDVEDADPFAPTEQQLRFSLAGVQLKFSALEAHGRRDGLTIPADGAGGSWIVKLPSLRHEGVPENEFAMMRLAGEIGIEVPDVRLVDITDIDGLPDDIGKLGPKAFAVRRFDRSPKGAVHIEDFAQVFGVYPDEKYERATYRSLLSAIAQAADLESSVAFMRRLVFCALIGNGDMHLKNWSLIYPDQRTPRLSPAYDLLSTIPYIPGDDSALKFARVKRFAEFSRDEIAYMAAKAGLPETPLIAAANETVERFMAIWESEKAHMGLMGDVIEAVDVHLATLRLLKEGA